MSPSDTPFLATLGSSRQNSVNANCLGLFRWREKRGNLPWRKLAFPRARQRRGVDGPVVCDTAEACRTIKYVRLVSFRCKSEPYRKTNNINKRRLMGQPCKSALIFIQKSSDLKHQENFSKGTPLDKLSVKHLAQGWRGDWQVPSRFSYIPI